MASPLPANFLELARENANEALTLVKIELTEPSALTLRFGEEEVTTPDGQTWEKGLADPGVTTTASQLLQTRLAAVSYSCELADLEYSVLTGKLSASLSAYLWNAATITVYLWYPRLASFADAGQVFTGQITFVRAEGLKLVVDAERTFTFNKRLPAEQVTRSTYPRAPERSIDRPIPFIIGSHRTPPALSPASAYGGFQWGIVNGRGARGGLRGVVASTGRGDTGEKGLVLFASHACHALHDETIGCSPFLEYGDKLCDVDPIGGDIVNSSSLGAGFRIADVTSGGTDPFDVFFPIPPQDIVLSASNNCENGRALLDPLNLRSYARFDYDAGLRNLTARLGTGAGKGLIRDIILTAGFTNSNALSNVLGPYIRLDGVGGAAYIVAGSSATPQSGSVSLNPINWPTEAWDFSQLSISCGFSGVATGHTMQVYWVALVILFRPEWPIIEGGSQRTVYVHREPITIRGKEIAPARDLPRLEITPPRREFDSNAFYCAVEGVEDPITFTAGGPGTLIELAPDALNWLLQIKLGVSDAVIETGASTFGSLVKARDAMKTWRGSAMKAALGITEYTMAERVIEDLCSAGLMLPMVNPFTGKWSVVPWRDQKPVDYDWTFGFDDMLDGVPPDCEQIPTDVENDFDLEYWIDDWSKLGGLRVALGPERSNAGHLYGQIRDEHLTVVTGDNDKINFTDSGARTATLTAGDYAYGGDLASEAQTKMRAAAGGGRVPFVSYGFHIVAGVNDDIDMVENGVALVATIAAGYYATGTLLAAAVETAMNAASLNASTYACTFSETTRKFTISQAGAIGFLNSFSFAAAATNFLTCAAMPLGFNFNASTYPDTSDNEVESENFYFSCSGGSLVLNWETGADGINAATPRQAAALFGHDPQRDRTATGWLTPHSPKSAREQAMAISRARYGSPDPRPRQFRAVNDTDTIRQIRNILAALLSAAPVRVFFRTTRAPDLELGRIIGFDDSLDEHRAYPEYGSDGSWAGKKFVVLGVTHYLGSGLKHQQIHAASIP